MIKLVLAGTSGYGAVYLKFLLDEPVRYDFKLMGVVDPFVEKSPYYNRLIDMKVPMYNNMEDFYKENEADLAIISSPIQFHTTQTEIALINRSNVLCEKPMCAGPDDIEKMISFKTKYKNFVEIGFQWSHAQPVLSLKKDILSGLFGKALQYKTLVLWPRNHDYFNRNNWAGKIKYKDGSYILDSVANNATAHYLHNMFFLAGDTMQNSASPVLSQCILAKANNIENYDTITVKGKIGDNIDMYFVAAHPVSENIGPVFELKFEKATVSYHAQQQSEIIAEFTDGQIKNYGDPTLGDSNKLWICMDKILDPDIELPCTVDTASNHAKFIYELYKTYEINSFKEESVFIKNIRNKPITIVEGLDNALLNCYFKMEMIPDYFLKV